MPVTFPKVRTAQTVRMAYYLECGKHIPEHINGDPEILEYIEWLENIIEQQVDAQRKAELNANKDGK